MIPQPPEFFDLYSTEHRRREAGCPRHCQAIRRGAVRLPGDLERAVRLLDLIIGDRRVGHRQLRAAAGEGEVGSGLGREHEHVDGALTR